MRSRNIKPGFFKNEQLAELSPLTRILFQGLWAMADRDGRLEDRPMRIKAEILPYDNCDIEAMLASLDRKTFIFRYTANGEPYIQIVNFCKHQNPHPKEAKSTIPHPQKSVLKSLENKQNEQSRGNSETSSGNSGTSRADSLHSIPSDSPFSVTSESPSLIPKELSAGADESKGKPGKTQQQPTPDGYGPFVDHAVASYRAAKGVGMQFGDREGKIVKGLLMAYSLPQLKALWDMFLSRSWGWTDKGGKSIAVPHDVAVFWEKAKVLVDEPEFKTRTAKYEKEILTNPEGMAKIAGLAGKVGKPI